MVYNLRVKNVRVDDVLKMLEELNTPVSEYARVRYTIRGLKMSRSTMF